MAEDGPVLNINYHFNTYLGLHVYGVTLL